MPRDTRRRSGSALTPILLTGAALILIILGGGFLWTYSRWEGQPPVIAFDRDFKVVGRTPAIAITVNDTGSGLKQVRILLKSKDGETELVNESFGQSDAAHSKTYDAGKLIAEKSKLQEGAASLVVQASDHALLRFLSNNSTEVVKEFSVDLTPPRLEVLSGQHYINQGGSECVLYRVSEDAEITGIQAGPNFFPGFPADPADPQSRFALFGFVYDLPADTPVKVVARDAAGNQSEASFWQKVFPKKFRSRDIPLDDKFLQRVVPEILPHAPSIANTGNVVESFVKINSDLRRENHKTIADLAKASEPAFLWNGPFLQLGHSQVEAFFADRRTYVYDGKPIDQQDHVGFDLSVVARAPIEAGNDGKVVLADYFGIYGNTVILDHGAGLLSLYGHMSSIDVKVGQTVHKKDSLGRSGATGLAGGDHLHFGLFLQGIPVNPTEWWDAKWIKEHVQNRFDKAKSGEEPAEEPVKEPKAKAPKTGKATSR